MEGNYWTGIDISKRRLDWQINDTHNQPLITGTAQNSPHGITRLLEKWARQGSNYPASVYCGRQA